MLSFTPYIAAVLILAAVGYFMSIIFKAGKVSEREKEESNALDIKTKQDAADRAPSLTAGDILDRMRNDKL